MKFTTKVVKDGKLQPMWNVVIPLEECEGALKLGAELLLTLRRKMSGQETVVGANAEGVFINFRATYLQLERFSSALMWLQNQGEK